MFEFDEDFIKKLGLDAMPLDEKRAFLAYAYNELKLRVGTELAKDMDEAELADFNTIIGNQQAVFEWLQANRPDYKQIVRQEVEKLQQEIIEGRNQLLGT